MIERAEHSEIALGENEDTCYTVEKDEFSEKNRYEEYPVYLPWEHLPQPDGRVCDEGLGEKGWACLFESTWRDVLEGCQGLLRELLQERGEQNGTE